MNTPRSLPPLTPDQARVLAVLIEKERTVPDTYPMTLNALVAGCNQKTSRDPVMALSESDALEAIDALKRLSLVIESSGSRVMRYAQNLKRVIEVPTESVALLATLMLRGPQTAAELRTHAERLHRISDVSATEAFLDELARRPAGALVLELPRQPGARENRWVHLLCGPVDVERIAHRPSAPDASPDDAGVAALADDVARLREEVAALRAELAALSAELGIRR
jgi:uncharacterized protein YceH (UPF0502 family)